jgi:DNA-binding PadR family transcriptional regulator
MKYDMISNAEAALLGLLSEGSMHPYQIEKEVKFRDMRFWTELSMSSIYKLLRKLEKEELVMREDVVTPENRLRKLYTISKKGKKALLAKLESILSNPDHIKWQIDIATYNCNLLSKEKIQESLEKYKSALLEKKDGYDKLLKFLENAGCPAYRFEVAKRPVFLIEAEIKWINSFLKQYK